jgi:hypothetical protein
VCTARADSATGKQVIDLPDCEDGDTSTCQPIEQRLAGRLQRVIVPIRRSLEGARRTDERPSDNAAHAHAARYQIERNLADAILLLNRNDVFVRGNLKNTVRGGVDNRFARLHMLDAETVDDLCSRRHHVAKGFAPDPPLELRDDVGWETMRKRRERLVEHDAHHFPVAGDRSPSRRCLRHPSVCTDDFRRSINACGPTFKVGPTAVQVHQFP